MAFYSASFYPHYLLFYCCHHRSSVMQVLLLEREDHISVHCRFPTTTHERWILYHPKQTRNKYIATTNSAICIEISTFLRRSKSWLNVLGIMPAFGSFSQVYSFPDLSPSMVKVLPVPVWPYLKCDRYSNCHSESNQYNQTHASTVQL